MKTLGYFKIWYWRKITHQHHHHTILKTYLKEKFKKVLFKIRTPNMYNIFKISIATAQLDIGQHVCSLNNVVSQKILFCTSAFHYCLQSINYIFEAKKVTWFQQNYPFSSHFYQLILQGAPPWICQVLAFRKPFKKNVLDCRGGGGQLK